MPIQNKKKEKITVKPTQRKKGELVERRPYDNLTDIDRLFDQFRANFEDLLWYPRMNLRDFSEQIRTPSMDVVDLGDKYQLTVEMPGISRDDINIEVTPNDLEISAEKKTQDEEKRKNWLKRERSSTSFYRYLELPEELKTNDVDAQFKDGILTLTLPKVEPKRTHESKKVKVK
jgi:HSP20 family protein